jgi:hypothetical protein
VRRLGRPHSSACASVRTVARRPGLLAVLTVLRNPLDRRSLPNPLYCEAPAVPPQHRCRESAGMVSPSTVRHYGEYCGTSAGPALPAANWRTVWLTCASVAVDPCDVACSVRHATFATAGTFGLLTQVCFGRTKDEVISGGLDQLVVRWDVR